MKRRQLKTEIISKSFELFKEKGYNHTSIQDICDACDITKPTFYKYMPSKDSLLSYYFSSLFDKIPEDWYHIPEKADCLAKIDEGFSFVIERICDLGFDLYNEVFISNLNAYKGTFNDMMRFTDLIRDLIREGQANGQIGNTADPLNLTRNAVGMSIGYGAYWCLNSAQNDFLSDFLKGLHMMLMVPEEYAA